MVFKCEHNMWLSGFVKIGILVKANWVDNFSDLVRATSTS